MHRKVYSYNNLIGEQNIYPNFFLINCWIQYILTIYIHDYVSYFKNTYLWKGWSIYILTFEQFWACFCFILVSKTSITIAKCFICFYSFLNAFENMQLHRNVLLVLHTFLKMHFQIYMFLSTRYLQFLLLLYNVLTRRHLHISIRLSVNLDIQ